MSGDFLTIGASVIQAFRNWPEMAIDNEKISYDGWISYHKHTGERVFGPGPIPFLTSDPEDKADVPSRIYRHHRPKLHQMLLN